MRCNRHVPTGDTPIAGFLRVVSIAVVIISALQMTCNSGAVRSGKKLYQQKDDDANDRKGDDKAKNADHDLENEVHRNRGHKNDNERFQAQFSLM